MNGTPDGRTTPPALPPVLLAASTPPSVVAPSQSLQSRPCRRARRFAAPARRRLTTAAATGALFALLLPVVRPVASLRTLPRDHGSVPPDRIIEEAVRAHPRRTAAADSSSSAAAAALPTPLDHRVDSLPLLDSSSFPTRHYAGLLPVSRVGTDDRRIFYWLFEPDFTSGSSALKEDEAAEVPLLIWLNGGPGCSSMMGLWLENGPFRLDNAGGGGGNWTVRVNPNSWHAAPAWVLYVDQPVGTGLSVTRGKNYCRDDACVNDDFYSFLETFLLVYEEFFLRRPTVTGEGQEGAPAPAYALNRRLFFSGESHAGHYIPSMIDDIFRRNDDVANPPRIDIPVAGAAIGNGWTDPYHQYSASDVGYSFGFLDGAQKAALDRLELTCRESIVYWLRDRTNRTKHCLDLVELARRGSGGARGYDARTYGGGEYPPGRGDVERYLNGRIGPSGLRRDLRAALHLLDENGDDNIVGDYGHCNGPPYHALFHQDALGVVDELVRVLDHPTRPRILLYYGMADFVCNHPGAERMLDNLPWSRAKSWTLAERYSWDGPGNAGDGDGGFAGPAGYVKAYENLAFLKLPNSGHMVPMDLPEVSLGMMRTFLDGGCFRTQGQGVLGRGFPREVNWTGRCEACPSCGNVTALRSRPIPAAPSGCSTPPTAGGDGGSSTVGGSRALARLAALAGATFTFFVVTSVYILVSFDPRKAGAVVVPGNDDEDNGSGARVNRNFPRANRA